MSKHWTSWKDPTCHNSWFSRRLAWQKQTSADNFLWLGLIVESDFLFNFDILFTSVRYTRNKLVLIAHVQVLWSMVVWRVNFCVNNLFDMLDEIGGTGAAKKALLVWTIWHSSHHSVHFSLVGLFVVFRRSVVLNRRTGGPGKAR